MGHYEPGWNNISPHVTSTFSGCLRMSGVLATNPDLPFSRGFGRGPIFEPVRLHICCPHCKQVRVDPPLGWVGHSDTLGPDFANRLRLFEPAAV